MSIAPSIAICIAEWRRQPLTSKSPYRTNASVFVLMLLSSIDSQHTDISAHVSTIKGDPNGMGANFELTAEHLLRADPVEKNKAKSKNRPGGPSISATLGGKGPKTGALEFSNPSLGYR